MISDPILIITHKEDYTADYIINKLNTRSIPYVRLNTEDIIENNIQIKFNNSPNVILNDINCFHSIWYRRRKTPEINYESLEESLFLKSEIDTFLSSFLNSIKSKWLNHADAIVQAENKAHQLQVARQIGFNIPETIITHHREAIREFVLAHDTVIIKPLARSRIDYINKSSRLLFTSIIEKKMIEQLDQFEITPAIFQKFIEKSYELRVTVVGTEVFAAKVDSQSDPETKIDWRRKQLKFMPYSLPAEISDLCLKVTKELNIQFGAFDLIRSTDDKYYFLEVNPNGQWVWIEKDTGLQISESIINYLIS
jgi:glutathione synthase/RimK-type ligase-like ATP-grasp enzyme